MTITFNDLCSLLEGAEKISVRHPRLLPAKEKDAIQTHIKQWFAAHRQALDSSETNAGALLSAIFPHRRKDRVYGLQQALLSKKLLKLLQFDRNHGQLALFNQHLQSSSVDLGESIRRAMKKYDGTFKKKSTTSIDRVDMLLTQLAAKYRFSDPSIRQQRDWHMRTDDELKSIITRLDSWEAKWFVRLILRDYPTAALDETYVYEQYHFLLPDLLKFQNDYHAAFGMLKGELSIYPSVPEPSRRTSMRIEASQQLKAVVGVKVGRPPFHKAWSFKNCFQLTGKRAWAAEVKYDGEYCELHVNLDDAANDIQIFSKNGKDATADRQLLQQTIRDALRIGKADCMFRRKCIVLGEMVLWSDREKKILPFSKIRKHISRSGSFLGTLQDSLPHEWEHLMLVFFDVLMVDDEPIMRRGLQDRRQVLRNLVKVIPGRSNRSGWTLVDFKTEHGVTDLKQAFARTLASRQEGLVLKPLHAPYFPLYAGVGDRQPGCFIKLKKDYLNDMGGQRDLGDFTVIGACLDAQTAPKARFKPLLWTHFHLACVVNKTAAQRIGAKPRFKVVACLSLDKCIPAADVKYLNQHGQFQKVDLSPDGSIDAFDIDHGLSYDRRMTVAFKKPFVVEILGGGFEKVQNETFEMLRHPRVKKIHHDRTWEDTVTMEELERMADKKWDVPDADQLDGHAKDVAVLVKKYVKEMGGSHCTTSDYATTQETTQQTTQRTTQHTADKPPSDATVQETPQSEFQNTHTTLASSLCAGSTQGNGIRAFGELRLLVREDTSERIPLGTRTTPQNALVAEIDISPITSTENAATATLKRILADDTISPPSSKRRRTNRCPLEDAGARRSFGAFSYDTQEKTIHIYASAGLRVQVHSGPHEDD
jgi:DNA ligase-4